MSAELRLTVNGKPAVAQEGVKLAEFAQELGLPPRGVAIALNGEIVPRSQWAFTLVREGCAIEVVSIAAGG